MDLDSKVKDLDLDLDLRGEDLDLDLDLDSDCEDLTTSLVTLFSSFMSALCYGVPEQLCQGRYSHID